jgi:hypothetical protein
MRWLLGLLGAGLLWTASAYAQSAYDEVPMDHWAYGALEYLTERGVLEGYPDGTFSGDRTLTRYEFAQATARLLDSVDATDCDERINILAETLRAEFSDQLIQLQMQTAKTTAQAGELEMRVGALEGNVATAGETSASLEQRLGKMKPGLEWKGELMYRWEYENRARADTFERFRQRIRFQLGFTKKLGEQLELGARLKTQTGVTPVSGQFPLGSRDGASAGIYLDRAYVKYSPAWFGYYLAGDCETCEEKLDLYAGIFPQINHDLNEAILDVNVNLQGLGAVYHFNREFQILTAVSAAVEENTGELDDDAVLSITEARHDDLFVCGLDVWAGCYCWLNESALPDGYFANNRLAGFDFNNNGTPNEGGDRFSSQFKTAKVGAQYTFDCVWEKPLAIYAEYLVNTDSDAEDRIATVNPFITPDIVYESTDDTGFVVGTQWGEKPAEKGDWYWFVRYKEIGANAVIDGFSRVITGGANTNSFEAHANWMWADNAQFGITYLLNRRHNAFGFQLPNQESRHQVVRIDWNFKF